MSSPTRYNRSVLSPKPQNTPSSPTKRVRQYSGFSRKSLSSRQLNRLLNETKRSQKSAPSPGFTIYEDPVKYIHEETGSDVDIELEYYSKGSGKENMVDTELHQLSNKQNHLDQENILQPRCNVTRKGKGENFTRHPLSNLDISEHPGYITFGSVDAINASKPYALVNEWIPTNYNNEQKSLHKFNDIPSYITPPRSQKSTGLDSCMNLQSDASLTEKYLYRSQNNQDINNQALEETHELAIKGYQNEELAFDEEDEVDMHLQRKMRKRAYSVGKNNTKLKLIKKNNFQIMPTSI